MLRKCEKCGMETYHDSRVLCSSLSKHGTWTLVLFSCKKCQNEVREQKVEKGEPYDPFEEG